MTVWVFAFNESAVTCAESVTRGICGGLYDKPRYGAMENMTVWNIKCHLVNHYVPYLEIGPFHLEIKQYSPFMAIFHDFFTSQDWMMSYSKTRLSNSRTIADSTTRNLKRHELRYLDHSKKGITVAKTVQTWLNDVYYMNGPIYRKISKDPEPLAYDVSLSSDPYSFQIEYSVMLNVS